MDDFVELEPDVRSERRAATSLVRSRPYHVNHVANQVPLYYGVAGYVPPTNLTPTQILARKTPPITPHVRALQAGWQKKKAQITAGKYHIPDSEDPDTVRHLDWYEATGFRVPFPGETKVRPASDFNNRRAPLGDMDDLDK